MTIKDYKTFFSDYNSGPASFIHILFQPIATKRDVAIKQDDIDKLNDSIIKSEQHRSAMLIFYGCHTLDKAMQLNHLCNVTKQSVCFIDCQRLVDRYIGETEKHLLKLVAQAESKNWILFFDEADALFNRRSKVKENHEHFANQEVSYLFKRLSQYPELSIFSLVEKSIMDRIQYSVDRVITFR